VPLSLQHQFQTLSLQAQGLIFTFKVLALKKRDELIFLSRSQSLTKITFVDWYGTTAPAITLQVFI